MDDQSALIKGIYHKAAIAAVGDLKKASFAKVDSLLLRGDAKEEVYQVQDLLSGAVGGVKYSPEEIAGYQGIRQIMDNLHAAKDAELVRERRAKNIKDVEWDGQSAAVKTYADPAAAGNGFRQAGTNTHRIVRQDEDGAISIAKDYKAGSELDGDWLKGEYGDGYTLVRASENSLLKTGDTAAEWALVKADSLTVASGPILGKRAGYMPKINKGANFFVKAPTELNIAGRAFSGVPETLRYFDNYRDAQTWAKRHPEAAKLEVVANRG
jgi:hypothetical protein